MLVRFCPRDSCSNGRPSAAWLPVSYICPCRTHMLTARPRAAWLLACMLAHMFIFYIHELPADFSRPTCLVLAGSQRRQIFFEHVALMACTGWRYGTCISATLVACSLVHARIRINLTASKPRCGRLGGTVGWSPQNKTKQNTLHNAGNVQHVDCSEGGETAAYLVFQGFERKTKKKTTILGSFQKEEHQYANMGLYMHLLFGSWLPDV